VRASRARLAAAAVVLATTVAAMTHAQSGSSPGASQRDPWLEPRRDMVEQQIRERGVHQRAVLDAMESVPRHLFIPEESRDKAYFDSPLPIGWGQTISQPYIVARMTELLDLGSHDKVLEIGTGSGYHAAVLSRVAGEVYTIEIIDRLGEQARETLRHLGYDNVHVRVGDGYKGWPEEAPFDAIILTAAPPRIPQPLLDQLKVGGRMVAPVGQGVQDLQLLTKTPQGMVKRTVAPVRFVPMTGEVQKENPG
jgi:protein-L-isoaspartate(D-aspartate) O-methyltransferase